MGLRLQLVFMIIISLFSCKEKHQLYNVEFKLAQFKKIQYDLYNPILNTFKFNSLSRIEHPNYYDYDSYYDYYDTLRFLFYRSESYGFLQEFEYDSTGKLSRTKIYSVLAGIIDKNENLIYIDYFYLKGNLRVIRDDLNKKLLFIEAENVIIYEGVLDKGIPFNIKSINIKDYYIRYLN